MQRYIETPVPPPFNVLHVLWELLLVEYRSFCGVADQVHAQLTPATAYGMLARVQCEKFPSWKGSDSRDGGLLAEEFRKQRAAAAQEAVELKREKRQAELLRRLDALALWLDKQHHQVGAVERKGPSDALQAPRSLPRRLNPALI